MKEEAKIEKRGFNLKQAAEYLGVGEWYLRRKAWKGEIETHKLGNRLIFEKKILDAHFKSGER